MTTSIFFFPRLLHPANPPINANWYRNIGCHYLWKSKGSGSLSLRIRHRRISPLPDSPSQCFADLFTVKADTITRESVGGVELVEAWSLMELGVLWWCWMSRLWSGRVLSHLERAALHEIRVQQHGS